MKRIVCVGGGPAGLYAAILFKKALPGASVEVYERNRPDDTFGWGVVFSDQTLQGFRATDPESHDAIVSNFHHWDDIDVYFKGERVRSGGHGFCGISRQLLLNKLQERAATLGVKQTFQHEIEDPARFADADLIVAADGVNSRTRKRFASVFEPDIDARRCRYIWLGTRQRFPAFTFAFERTEHGWFQIHAYQFSDELSTVIVETREETWKAHGIDRFGTQQSIEFCEQLFGRYLDGHKLMSNANHLRGSAWLNFSRVLCKRWHTGNIVLIGDAAHTAHFSIGSGTKLAMEDAASLVKHVAQADVEAGLESYQAERSLEALKLQSAARNRMEWFENVARYVHLEPLQFAYSLLTGSQRIGHDNLRLRDGAFVDDVERDLAQRAGVEGPRPPMFLPFKLRGMELVNRIVVSPMAQYQAVDGVPGDWHLMHYGSRAAGGAGLVITEMTCVSPIGRISPGCTGLWNDRQRDAWKRIVDFVHAHSAAKFSLQLGHSGRKGSTQLGWERADHPLDEGNWELIAPSPLPYLEGISQMPRAMTREDMEEVAQQFVHAAELGAQAGFDMLELHMAHGYLLASFLSPLTNRRDDEFGGQIEKRMRFPLAVFKACRAVWPADKPMSVRVSASDWAEGGLSEADLVTFARALREAGADLIDVSTGQTVPWQKPVYGRMYQTPFSDLLRNSVDIATIAVGNIYEADHVNSIIAAGRADLCALARPHLADPSWTLHAAAAQNWTEQHWPKAYLSGKSQLERNLARASQMIGAV
ncbi:bifunctional salicylyl-CoA 5-hydroxylase/oxidoreductase [Peristeroidobacter agariperforans]|uniref:bifunctional salicylyl-CoA 5-hydroxylase/oxidoreductase n=1 Tax=Peristeroidobacter agariperforans TaxID=268404 RepID=UPI00101D8C29|nr:bifunctional salicylyl-CoA 5-hydroxylase/oxidoreductase [Peristeroidobacter agariperforans]